MATMVKEKRREKKKHKDKHVSTSSKEVEQPSIIEEKTNNEQSSTNLESTGESSTNNENLIEGIPVERCSSEIRSTDSTQPIEHAENLSQPKGIEEIINKDTKSSPQVEKVIAISKELVDSKPQAVHTIETLGNTYKDLNDRLERITIPNLDSRVDVDKLQDSLNSPNAYIDREPVPLAETSEEGSTMSKDFELSAQAIEPELPEVIMPSAPMLEEVPFPIEKPAEQQIEVVKVKTHPMPLEEAIQLFGGDIIEEVKAMSEKEEAIVDAGPVSGPDHPLVDLLSTFRSSLRALERERVELATGFTEEEKSRNTLWKIEKKKLYVSEKCKCGLDVTTQLVYEHAELMKARLPVAKMKLESLLRDVQESYCHHQHTALLAHCQIEELISEIIQRNKNEIREALSLILQALRLSDSAPAALAVALQRWAGLLSAAMLDGRDLRQLLHLMHHLFRQARSVRWAARVMFITVGDRTSAAQAIAVLDLLMARPKLEPALECTEETEEAWEEVDKHGGGGAVSDGTLREKDLLSLLRVFPMRDLVARLLLFTHSDIKQARDYEWDASGGHGVLKSCCGIRTLLNTLQRAILAHPHYTRLHTELRLIAIHALHALAALHKHSSYSKGLEEKIWAELEACYAAGVKLFNSHHIYLLPTALLADDTAKNFCAALIRGVHDKTPILLEDISIELPVWPCEERTCTVTQASIYRSMDHDLARMVLDFLFQTGIKRKTSGCKGTCDVIARALLPCFLDVHHYLHAMAFHMLADLYQVDPLNPSSVRPLAVNYWRPSPGEITEVLTDWSQRCPQLLQHLLLLLKFTPNSGLSLESQLTVGTWLCEYQKANQPTPEWAWEVLRRLKVHRSNWNIPIDAPPPDSEPSDLFSTAYAVLATSWGHSVPEICSAGVSGLCQVAVSRPYDAVHCLAPVMIVMAHSPESISFTPKFNELFTTLLNSGPTMLQRALGRGPVPGSELLLRTMLSQIKKKCSGHTGVPRSSILSAWLHGVWRVTSPTALQILDTALLYCREWALYDTFANNLMQEESSKEHISQAVRHASCAPLISECILRAAHTSIETRSQHSARLLDALHSQRVAGDRIHVDNALKYIGASISSEDLVIYRTATAALAALIQHPAQLMLWSLFMHLYLQRPPCSMLESTPPVGPLFFSGLIKSRTLAQIRKRLLETVTYHNNEADSLKKEQQEENKNSIEVIETRPERPMRATEDSLLPSLSIKDLTGESSDSDTSSSEEEREEETLNMTNDSVQKRDLQNLMSYHAAAEKMIREYIRWLDEGDKTRAMQHHAALARFMPEPALEAAWQQELSRRRTPTIDDKDSPPTTPLGALIMPLTPFQAAISHLLKIRDRSGHRSRRPSIKSPLENVNYKDAKMLLSFVEKHLTDMETLAREWSKEVSHLSSLDAALWDLVCSLRVCRRLPVVKKACANLCKPINLIPQESEWCISVGAERGIVENRRSASAGIRRLARARPHAASSAAALHSIARHVSSSETARRVCARAWRSAGVATNCAPARTAITALVEFLAERWLCHEARVVCELLSQWGGDRNSSPLQQSLCGALISPRRLAHQDWPVVYAALLKTPLPEHAAFSYLSKFELSWWSSHPEAQRRPVLDALLTAAQRFGCKSQEQHVLLELIGVHTTTILNEHELCAHIKKCTAASIEATLPPTYWTHVVKATDLYARNVPFDQLGHLLRETGVMWWEVRTQLRGKKNTNYAIYSLHIADLLRSLQRAFVAAAVALSYAPERVSLYAWSSLLESWSPWVSPHSSAAPLLSSMGDDESYTPMLRHFVDDIHQIMLDCPGTEERLLQQIFDWTVQTYVAVNKTASQESSIQLSALLVELRNLPWTEHQWMCSSNLQVALKIASSPDKEITSWCASAWKSTSVATWLRDVTNDNIAPHLAALLYLITSMTHSPQTLEEATYLPWWRLPETALDEALTRFFANYHNPAIPYHEVLQFRVLLYASELSIRPEAPPPREFMSSSRLKRCSAVSQWTRAACAPTLSAHVAGFAKALLGTFTDIAPHIETSDGEIEELLGRAVIVMCMEPAATAALPVWQEWVSNTNPRMMKACISAAGTLTTFEYFAALADTALKAHITQKESTGWSEVITRWQSCHWCEPAPLTARSRLHCAYAVLIAHEHKCELIRDAFLALLAAKVNFVEDEAIASVWICLACRVSRLCSRHAASGGDCSGAARTLLTCWAEDARRSLLRVVTMQADTSAPTNKHRLLCRLALCMISPSETTIKSYETLSSSLLGQDQDVLSWGRNADWKKLPQLTVRLHPTAQKYFMEEMDRVETV